VLPAKDLPFPKRRAKVQARRCFSIGGDFASRVAIMFAGLFQGFDWEETGIWLPTAIGFACGCLTTLFVQATVRRAPQPQAAAAENKSGTAKKPTLQELAAMGVSAEKRGTVRRSGNAVPVFVEEGDGVLVRGYVVDRSAGGIGLALDHSLSLGTIVRVRPSKAPDTAPWVAVQVKSCRAEGTEYELGCQFQTLPPFNVMLLFG